MFNFHEIIRPKKGADFFKQTVDLFSRKDAGHMGAQMYQHHDAMLNGCSMSGVLTWKQHAKNGSFPKLNKEAFDQGTAIVLGDECLGLPIVEYGPGSMEDACRLIQLVQAKEYVPVDLSLGIIKQAEGLSQNVTGCCVRPSVLDFFARPDCILQNEPALCILLGVTITNIPGPVPKDNPRTELTQEFKNLSNLTPKGGYLLVSMDACQSAELNQKKYNEQWHKLFGVNHVFRMAEELPMKGFDPCGFDYYPQWHPHCSLLAHTIRATKDQDFEMGEGEVHRFSVKTGDVFHYNNSFKYQPAFFESCAEQAGLTLVRQWQSDQSICLYLFQLPDLTAA